jgi:hypothetical protein
MLATDTSLSEAERRAIQRLLNGETDVMSRRNRSDIEKLLLAPWRTSAVLCVVTFAVLRERAKRDATGQKAATAFCWVSPEVELVRRKIAIAFAYL